MQWRMPRSKPAASRHSTLPGKSVAARLVKDLIRTLALNETACKDTCPTHEQTLPAIDATPRWLSDLVAPRGVARTAATRGPTPRS
jgi:hypothetical protein